MCMRGVLLSIALIFYADIWTVSVWPELVPQLNFCSSPRGCLTPGEVRSLLPWLAVVWFGKFIWNMFKVNALTKPAGNGMCSGSKRHESKGGSQDDYAETESLSQMSKQWTLPLTQKKENNATMAPVLTYLKYKISKPKRLRNENQHTKCVSNISYIFFWDPKKNLLTYLSGQVKDFFVPAGLDFFSPLSSPWNSHLLIYLLMFIFLENPFSSSKCRKWLNNFCMLLKRKKKSWVFPNCLLERGEQSQCTLRGLSPRHAQLLLQDCLLYKGLSKPLLTREHGSFSLPPCNFNSRAFL